jgi:hypothetical protein
MKATLTFALSAVLSICLASVSHSAAKSVVLVHGAFADGSFELRSNSHRSQTILYGIVYLVAPRDGTESMQKRPAIQWNC